MKLNERAVTRCALAALATAAAFYIGAVPTNAAPAPARCTERANGGPEVAFGLTTDQRLICFKLQRPSEQTTLLVVSQLQAPDTRLIGIDTRPATGAIWALGNAGGLYVIDPSAAKVDFKSRLNVALEGQQVGMDFNPTVDRLRIVTETGQNLRVNVDTGVTTIDGFLKTGTARTSGVGGAAYTNNDNDPTTATTLFDLDTAMDQLVTQNPPNDGVLNSVGRLGFQGNSAAAFDIQSTIVDGKAVANAGYAALDGGDVLFSIDLSTGRASFVGQIGTKLAGLTFPM